MKITEEAGSIIKQAFLSNNCDCLKTTLQKSCCGTSLVFNLTKIKSGDNSFLIDGIPVMMDSKTQERAKAVTIAADNGELIIQDEEASSCCG